MPRPTLHDLVDYSCLNSYLYRSGSYSPFSAGVFTVREFFCWLTDRVRTVFFLQAARMFTVRPYNGVFSFLDITNKLYCIIEI